MSEIVILGAQHENNLGRRAVEYAQPQVVMLEILLEDYTNTSGRTERRLAAYELDDDGTSIQRIGYPPMDATRLTGRYVATLQRSEGKQRIHGRLCAPQTLGEETASATSSRQKT
jgi:hypothetical protein